MRHTILFVAALCTSLSGCGGGEPPSKSADDATHDESPRRSSGNLPDVSAEIGALDKAEVIKTFEAALPDMQACMNAGAKRVEFLGGNVEFNLKVDQRGALAEAFIERTTLGDRDTEKCLLSVLAKRTWPSPQGGVHGLAQKGLDFDMINDVRPPVMWDAERVRETLDGLADKISECKSGGAGTLSVTMYIGTGGDALGVGLAQSSAADSTAADCVVDLLRAAKFPSPGSWPAKVSFDL